MLTLLSTTRRGRKLGISFELMPAWSLDPPAGAPAGLTEAERHVFSWLVRYRDDIVAAEKKWRVDRRAIAAAIAWEALRNTNYFVPVVKGCGRSAGPGKVHYKSKIAVGEGNPVAKQVETAGYLPRLTKKERKRRLRDPVNAIDYIGAIMCAYADISALHGFDLRAREDLILTQPYNGVRRVGELDDLQSWSTALARHQRRGTRLAPANPMYLWANHPHARRLLEAAVGRCGHSLGAQPHTPGASAYVDLYTMRAWLVRDGRVIRGPVPIAAGGPGMETPVGTFRVLWKETLHISKEFHGVPMPNAVFFTTGGVAFHAGDMTRPSGACIKLDAEDAQAWFEALDVDDEIRVYGADRPLRRACRNGLTTWRDRVDWWTQPAFNRSSGDASQGATN